MLNRIMLSFILGFIILSFHANSEAAERFKWITSTDTYSIYYDTQTIRRGSDAWIKESYTEEGAREYVDSLRKSGVRCGEEYNKLKHIFTYYEINSSRQMRVITFTYYDENGNVIESIQGNRQWRNIIPDTIGEAIYNAIR